MSRVKDFHCYLQPQEVPYCSISVYSDRPEVSIDTFVFNQPCEGDLGLRLFFSLLFSDASLSSQELVRLKQSLQQVYAHMKENPRLVEFDRSADAQYLKHLIKCFVLHSKTHTHSAYLQHLREVVASLSSYASTFPRYL